MSVPERNLISVLKSLLPDEKVNKILNDARAEAEKNVQAGLVKLFEEAIWEAITEKQNPPECSDHVLQSPPVEDRSTATQLLVYLYCLTVKEAGQWLQATQLASIENENGFVDYVVLGDFCIVFSYVSNQVFGENVLEKNMQNMPWLEEKVTAHQSVIESLMKRYPVIPMKFCTIFNSVNRVKEVVHEKLDDFIRILDLVKDCQEWGLKVFYDAGRLQKYLETSSSKIKKLTEKANRNDSGTAYLIKKKLSETISEEVEATAFNFAEEFHEVVKEFARQYTLNKLLGREVTNRPEAMVLNVAYLVPKDQVEELKECVRELEGRYKLSGLILSFTGPWPPYNFTDTEGGAETDA